jgi:hypothetical protein
MKKWFNFGFFLLIRRLVQQRLLFSGLLVLLAGGLFLWATWWIVSSSMQEVQSVGEIMDSGSPAEDVRLTLQGLVARQVQHLSADSDSPAATAEPAIRAATARLSRDWSELLLERVSAEADGIPNTGRAGMPAASTYSFEISAGVGILDIRQGNLILDKQVRGVRSDGVRITADRMEYETGKSQIRFVSATFQAQSLENRSEMIITDDQLQRIRLNESIEDNRSKHPFFRKRNDFLE